MIKYISNGRLAQMPADKARALRKRAHVNDGRGIYIPQSLVEEVDAGMLNTPVDDLTEIVAGRDPTLLGNRLESFFNKWGAKHATDALARIGLPCNCKERRDFINHVHQKAREIKAKLTAGGG